MMKVHYKVHWFLHDAHGTYDATTYEDAMHWYTEFIVQGCRKVIMEMVIIGVVSKYENPDLPRKSGNRSGRT